MYKRCLYLFLLMIPSIGLAQEVDNGETKTGNHSSTKTYSYDEAGQLTGSFTSEQEGSGDFSRYSTAEYDANGQLISETSDETETETDDSGATVTNTLHEVTTANYDAAGNPLGYTSVEDFNEPLFGIGTLTSQYDANFKMLDGNYSYTDVNGAPQSGSLLDVEFEEYAEDGQTVVGHTEVELRFGTDGNAFEVNKYDAEWKDQDELDGIVNAPVAGSVSEATLVEDLNLLLNVEGSGFDTLVTGDVSGAVVNAVSGDLAGSSWLAVDTDGNDSFDQADALIEITGTNLVAFNNDAFV